MSSISVNRHCICAKCLIIYDVCLVAVQKVAKFTTADGIFCIEYRHLALVAGIRSTQVNHVTGNDVRIATNKVVTIAVNTGHFTNVPAAFNIYFTIDITLAGPCTDGSTLASIAFDVTLVPKIVEFKTNIS